MLQRLCLHHWHSATEFGFVLGEHLQHIHWLVAISFTGAAPDVVFMPTTVICVMETTPISMGGDSMPERTGGEVGVIAFLKAELPSRSGDC